MIPRTYPSTLNAVTGQRQLVALFLNNVTGLKRWSDYIPVNFGKGTTLVEGTFSASWLLGQDVTAAAILQADDGTSTNIIRIRYGAAGTTNDFAVITGGVTSCAFSSGAQLTPNTIYKTSGAYQLNNFGRSVDGAAVTTDLSGTVPTVTTFRIGVNPASIEQPNCHIRRIVYYPRRLSNSELQARTA